MADNCLHFGILLNRKNSIQNIFEKIVGTSAEY